MTDSPRPDHTSASAGFRPDIQGLRGVAVLLIVAFHAGVPGATGGFIGVDVFFVLSGYLITGLLVREITTTGGISLAHFYARRARRILPALACVLLATMVVALLALPPLEQKRVSNAAVATSAYLSNFYFLRDAAFYFDPDSETNPLLHTWSLGVEEQIYLVWPMVVALAFRGAGSKRRLAAVILVVAGISLAGCIWLTNSRPAWAFYGSPARLWEFALGGAASLLPAAQLQHAQKYARAAGWLGLAAILGAGVRFSPETDFPGVAALIPVLGTAAVLAAGMETAGTGVGVLLGSALLQRLGQLSYSWYLWHWPVLVFAGSWFPSLAMGGRILCILLALGLAAVTYRLVEDPVRFHPRLLNRSALTLALAAGVTILGIGLAGAWRQLVMRTAQYRSFTALVNDVPPLYQFGCGTPLAPDRPKECVFGDLSSPVTWVLLGDSHAAQWLPALERIANQRHWKVVTLIRTACPATWIPISPSRCSAVWLEAALQRTNALRPAGVIVGASSQYLKGRESTQGPERLGTGPTFEEWRDRTRRTLAVLDAAGLRTLMLHDTPRADYDVPVCLARAAWRGFGKCEVLRSSALDPAIFRAEQDLAQGFRHVSLLDLSDEICGPRQCDLVQNGVPVFRDRDHLTSSFAATLAPALASRLNPVDAGGLH